MGRLISIDYGTKRIGFAVTDPLKIIATALDVIHPKDSITFLKDYFQKEDVEAIILGYPLKLDSSETNNTQHVKGFHTLLKKHFPNMPIHLHDERFTSKMALDSMIRSGSSKKDRRNKGNIDKVSAVIILQSYLESQSMF